jgi:glyoxylase-like metal-dependent hydrolase (beta-lactamase superfamily II)
LHYDHCGNYDLFPRARYHLQDCEMAYATGRCMCHAHLRMPFEADDVTAMVRKVFADRVTFHDGDDELAPGVTVHHVGGHSRGLQCVRVKTQRGYVVLAADATHLYNHFEQRRVFPIVDSVARVLEGYNLLDRLATSRRHIIPGHDPDVLVRYPAARVGLEGWIARLDAEPKA